MPGVIRVQATISGGIPRTAYNIWHADVSDVAGVDTQAFVDALRDFYTSSATLFPSTETIQIGTSVTQIDVNPPVILGPTIRTVVGTGTGGASAAQLAEVVSWRTAFAGKSFRGRTYLGPIAVSALTGGILSTPVVTAVQNASNALVAASNAAGGWSLVVRSIKLNVSTVVTSGVANSKVETQRRRNR